VDTDDLFQAYWSLYRGESEIPASTDPEYTIALRLFNEGINHWETYDGTAWKELYAQFKDEEGTTVSTGTTDYDAPGNFKKEEGDVKVLDANDKILQKYPVVDIREVQFQADGATYAYFSGNPTNGHVLHLSPAPTSALNGNRIDYPYTKKATELVNSTDVPEMSDPYFLVHRALANRFRSTRNPYADDAKQDAENALGKMKLDNDGGTVGDPASRKDHSGSSWGQ
jgi:hypothetical protein